MRNFSFFKIHRPQQPDFSRCRPKNLKLDAFLKNSCNSHPICLILLPSESERKKQTTDPGEGRSSLPNETKNRDLEKRKVLQELHNISLHVERLQDFMNFQIKILQKKSEKAGGENSDVSEVLVIKTDQVSKNAANEERKTDWSVEKQYLWQAHAILQEIKESIQKREREVTELLQSEKKFNKAMKPQVTVLIFLKSLIKMVHTIYCDVPGAQQCIHQLIRKNKDERPDLEEVFNNAQADILSYEILCGNELMDDTRTHLPTKLFRNIGKAKSDLEYVETEKIVFECIQTGEIPNWIKRDCLYEAWSEDPAICSEEIESPFQGTRAEV
ncbi:uncharacterized protein LOC119695812 isoform X2 [Motacilla alba alba]|uniref:uncharacterized protein LOC119695812 isoform X2 n=1 Tax=Motacilla alba alba TaxID=1094192 RepID=UPI0018D4E0A0|nr:uncharacterized protein LOC119695812 isoform X2 [Motacilla alba alba]